MSSGCHHLARPTIRHQRETQQQQHQAQSAKRPYQRQPSALFATTTTEATASEQQPSPSSTDDSESMYTPYERCVRRLYQTNLFNPVKLGLQNIDALHEALGRPMDNPDLPVIHIAGTNGKGSVALKIANTIRLSNPSLRVGLFCSPHVSSFRERIQINGELIPEDAVVRCLPELYNLCQHHDPDNSIPATFFELTTALAFRWFRDADVVVLETGLGGRLDATNAIRSPALSVITSIGLEHTRILGDTVEEIAVEKAGIIKPRRPVLVGPNVPHEVLQQCANEKQASGYYRCEDVLGPAETEITDYDEENARTAEAAIELLKQSHPAVFGGITKETIAKGTAIRPPCRFEEVIIDGLTVVLDVAHNPPAMEYLIRKLHKTYPDGKFRFVVGMSSDKDVGLCGRLLLDSATSGESIHLVEAYHPRAAKLEAILEAEPRLQNSHWNEEDRGITKQITVATELAKNGGEILVVCGSVFLMSEAREALGFEEPRDSECIAEVAGSHLRHGQEMFGSTAGGDGK